MTVSKWVPREYTNGDLVVHRAAATIMVVIDGYPGIEFLQMWKCAWMDDSGRRVDAFTGYELEPYPIEPNPTAPDPRVPTVSFVGERLVGIGYGTDRD